jgi:hypothetical protein
MFTELRVVLQNILKSWLRILERVEFIVDYANIVPHGGRLLLAVRVDCVLEGGERFLVLFCLQIAVPEIYPCLAVV